MEDSPSRLSDFVSLRWSRRLRPWPLSLFLRLFLLRFSAKYFYYLLFYVYLFLFVVYLSEWSPRGLLSWAPFQRLSRLEPVSVLVLFLSVMFRALRLLLSIFDHSIFDFDSFIFIFKFIDYLQNVPRCWSRFLGRFRRVSSGLPLLLAYHLHRLGHASSPRLWLPYSFIMKPLTVAYLLHQFHRWAATTKTTTLRCAHLLPSLLLAAFFGVFLALDRRESVLYLCWRCLFRTTSPSLALCIFLSNYPAFTSLSASLLLLLLSLPLLLFVFFFWRRYRSPRARPVVLTCS